VVCPGAVVKRGQCIVDQLVAGHHGPLLALSHLIPSPAKLRPSSAWSNTADEDDDEQSWAMPTT
jgi:hypothetical protein